MPNTRMNHQPVGWDANPSIERRMLGLRFAPSQPTIWL